MASTRQGVPAAKHLMSASNFEELLAHVGHRVEVVAYGPEGNPVNVAVECLDCNEVLLDFDKDDTIRVVVVEPGKEPVVGHIYNTLSAMQDTVGGYIQCLPIENSLTLVCNEEGHLLALEPNRTVGANLIMGTFFVAAHTKEGEFIGLSDKEILHVMAELK